MVGRVELEFDGLSWPRGDGLVWPHRPVKTRLHERQHDLADCPGLPACNKTEWVDELSGQLAVLTAELVELEARS